MPSNLFIPSIGDTIILSGPWTFTLYEETRNMKLVKVVDLSYTGNGYPAWTNRRPAPRTWTVTMPALTTLIVDRIYIRNGNEDFSSLTFRTSFQGKNVRFWAKLDDVNKIVMV